MFVFSACVSQCADDPDKKNTSKFNSVCYHDSEMGDKRRFTAYRHREHVDEKCIHLCAKRERKDIGEAHIDG